MAGISDTPFQSGSDVAVNWTTSTQRTSRRAGDSRALNTTSAQLTLIHRPSQLQVVGNVAEGNYSKKEMQVLKQALQDRLFTELAQLVAKSR